MSCCQTAFASLPERIQKPEVFGKFDSPEHAIPMVSATSPIQPRSAAAEHRWFAEQVRLAALYCTLRSAPCRPHSRSPGHNLQRPLAPAPVQDRGPAPCSRPCNDRDQPHRRRLFGAIRHLAPPVRLVTVLTLGGNLRQTETHAGGPTAVGGMRDLSALTARGGTRGRPRSRSGRSGEPRCSCAGQSGRTLRRSGLRTFRELRRPSGK